MCPYESDQEEQHEQHLPIHEGYDDCDVPLTPDGPPVYNDDNCSSAEKADRASGSDEPDHIMGNPFEDTSKSLFFSPPLDFVSGHVPPSNTSSNLDVPCPEGIEHHAPPLVMDSYDNVNHQVAQLPGMSNVRWLSLTSGATSHEIRARELAIWCSQWPVALQTYLEAPEVPYAPLEAYGEVQGPSHESYTGTGASLPLGFLRMDVALGNNSMSVQLPSSRKSKLSHNSSTEYSSLGDYWTFHAATGWIDADGDVYVPENGYPMNLSGCLDDLEE